MLKTEIKDLIRKAKPVLADIPDTANLYSDLWFDSLSFVQLLTNIEEIYSISIDLVEMESCLMVDRLFELVESKLEAGKKEGQPKCQ